MKEQHYNKYGNKKVEIDGMLFDSTGEGRRYKFLKEQQEKGIISNLRMQVSYELIPKITKTEIVHLKTKDKEVERVDQKAYKYIADFVYVINETGEEVLEDFKGKETPYFRLKAALFYYRYRKK